MGNVNVRGGGRSSSGDLSPFQRSKLTFDFNTFFDLNNDGYLSYKVSFDVIFCNFLFLFMMATLGKIKYKNVNLKNSKRVLGFFFLSLIRRRHMHP
jgi:hypothetical protein